MRLWHCYTSSQPHIQGYVDNFGCEREFNFSASQGFGPEFQVSIHYLDGFCDPAFFEHVWGKQ